MTPPSDSAISPELRSFTAQSPFDRWDVLAFVRAAASETPAGARVLDAGAGEAPYRELFAHCDYRTSDFAASQYPQAKQADFIGALDDLPIESETFDVVVNTQVLEHVPRPRESLKELHRVLVPGGRLYFTAPQVNELHEEPYDFFRYTKYGLAEMMGDAGFEDVDIRPLNGYFSALAFVMRACSVSIGVQAVPADLPRRLVAAFLRWTAYLLPPLDRLDRKRGLPCGWTCRARRPAA